MAKKPNDKGDCACTFTHRQGDTNVTNRDDAELGHMIRVQTEQGRGVWLFETDTTPAVRWMRVVKRS